HTTEALGIQEDVGDDTIRVVGADRSADTALLWSKEGSSSWQVVTINSLLTNFTPNPDKSVAATVIEADDINGAGWMVGVAACPEGLRAVLIRPLPSECPSDLDLDGHVTAADLAILLGAWGASISSPTCDARSDIDHDGDVDATDLGILLGDWN